MKRSLQPLSKMQQDYTRFLTKESKERKPSAIRALQPLLQIPGMISLGGGMPHPSTFPFQSLQITLKNSNTVNISEANLAQALQYSSTSGLPQLLSFMKSLQQKQHKISDGYDIATFNGSQDALTKAFSMLLTEKDAIIVESPTYSGTLAFLRPLGCNIISVKTDEFGIVPEDLEKILRNHKVKYLYTIPVASNPSGVTTSLERKKEIYSLCCKYDLLLLEDDPYYYLQFQDQLVDSYLSIDTEMRVLRFDSFSKILSAGMRIGFATGPKALIERMVLHSQATSLHPSGLSQLFAIEFLKNISNGDLENIEPFLEHCKSVSEFYKQKRDIILKYMNKYLSNQAEWNIPSGGMFVWIKLKIKDSKKLIKEKAVEKKVLLLPGIEFMVNDKEECEYVRASYSTASEQEIEEAIKRLSDLLEDYQD